VALRSSPKITNAIRSLFSEPPQRHLLRPLTPQSRKYYEPGHIQRSFPNTALNVIDRAIQMHGSTGVSADTPLARMWASHRTLRLSDGPDEVHRELIARIEFGHESLSYL
jgi:alkylation response protein AidB-like acyl-CoA dehydrogenase